MSERYQSIRQGNRLRRTCYGSDAALVGARTFVPLLFTALSLLLGGAAAHAAPSEDVRTAPVSSDEASSADSEINASLDALAKQFAAAVTDRTLRESIHSTVGKRFDGDTNALWKSLATRTNVRSALAGTLSRERSITSANALKQIDTLAGRIPRFQIAVPKTFDAWDPATFTPLVGYVPEGIDDETLTTITAYDATGQAHALDAQVTPKRPVIILGVNERTDDSGALLPDIITTQSTDSSQVKVSEGAPSQVRSSAAATEAQPAAVTTEAQPAVAAAAAASYLVELNEIRVWNVHEPWSKGDAEFSFVAKSKGCSLYHLAPNVSGIDEDGDRRRWGGDGLDLGNSSCSVVMYFWEDDGGSYDFTLSYNGFSFGVKMDDADDLMGGHSHAASWFEGDTEQWYTGLDDLDYSME